MKTRFFLICVMTFAYSPLANAYNDKDARGALRTTIESLWTSISELRASARNADNRNIGSLNELRTAYRVLGKQIEELQISVSNLQMTVEGLLEKGTTLDCKGDKTDIKVNVVLWITIPIVMVICGVLGLAFWPRKSKSVVISSARPDQHKCPRCGWEHDPGATVCKNPDCKTQF